MGAMFQVSSGEYTISGTIGELPATYSAMIEHASFHDDFGVSGADGTVLVVAVKRASEKWPGIIVSQRFDPGPEEGFHPGTILIPENNLLLLGAGTRLLAYDLRIPCRLWEDVTEVGFWGWERYDDVVLMSAELELTAWDLQGKKLWSTFVKPPWDYEIQGNQIELDVMGKKSRFAVKTGPVGAVAS
jgi:hypothetical protein